jgi:hypothetical protein
LYAFPANSPKNNASKSFRKWRGNKRFIRLVKEIIKLIRPSCF